MEEEGLSRENYYDYFYKPEIKGFEDWPAVFSRVHSLIDELKGKEYKSIFDIVLYFK